MKTAIGGVSIFQLVIVFLLVFTGIMCLTINHSKAFGVKDELINTLETTALGETNATEKLSRKVREKLATQLRDAGYRATGTCGEGYTGYVLGFTEIEEAHGRRANICIRENHVANINDSNVNNYCTKKGCEKSGNDNVYPVMVYYDIVLFYQLDIPIINSVFNLTTRGTTKILYGGETES